MTIAGFRRCGRTSWLNEKVTKCTDCQKGKMVRKTYDFLDYLEYALTSEMGPKWAKIAVGREPKECPCGIHPADCEYHR